MSYIDTVIHLCNVIQTSPDYIRRSYSPTDSNYTRNVRIYQAELNVFREGQMALSTNHFLSSDVHTTLIYIIYASEKGI